MNNAPFPPDFNQKVPEKSTLVCAADRFRDLNVRQHDAIRRMVKLTEIYEVEPLQPSVIDEPKEMPSGSLALLECYAAGSERQLDRIEHLLTKLENLIG